MRRVRPAGLAAAAAAALALLGGCASIDPYAVDPVATHLQRADLVGECARQWQAQDAAVRAAGARDAQEVVIPGFPYLRLDRLGQAVMPVPTRGAGFGADDGVDDGAGNVATAAAGRAAGGPAPGAANDAGEPDATSPAWQAWRARLSALDRQARALERRNAGIEPSTDADAGAEPDLGLDLDECRQVLMQADTSATARQALRAAARVPDNYAPAWRALGLYPLTRLGFAAGIRAWQDRTREVFAQPLADLPIEGALQRLQPAAEAAAGLTAVAGLPARLPAALQDPTHPGGHVHPADAAALTDLLGDTSHAEHTQHADPSRGSGHPGGISSAHPTLLPDVLRALLRRHAPILEIDTTGAHDRVGPLAFVGSRVAVDLTAAPVAYVRQTQALLEGRLHRQLVYTFWFPRRPKPHALDLLGGELDALIWRVTLDDDGQALLYDSIHACGCYHLFFTTERMRPRPGQPAGQGPLDEGLFMPRAGALVNPRSELAARSGALPPHRTAPAGSPPVAMTKGWREPSVAPSTAASDVPRIVLRVQARTHYLQHVRWAAPEDASTPQPPRGAPLPPLAYGFVDEDTLRSLPMALAPSTAATAPPRPAHRSVYDPQGLIPGSERLERFLFWPMGIASAGQMRQWGRQATAFVGRRHFDDPRLLDRYFERVAPAPGANGGAPMASPASATGGRAGDTDPRDPSPF